MKSDKIVTLYYTKTFTSGMLNGLSINTHLSMSECLVAEFIAWGESGRASDCITKDKWIMTDRSFQNYDRTGYNL